MTLDLPTWLNDYIPEGTRSHLGQGCLWVRGQTDCRVKYSDSVLGGQLLQREALWLSRIRSARLSTHCLIDLIKDANRTILVTSYLPGVAASDWLRSQAECSDNYLDGLSNYIERMVEAVEQLHQQRVVHGDIKLGNIIFSEGGEVHLIDFSNSRRVNDPLEHRGLVQYTASYSYPIKSRVAMFEQDYYAVLVVLSIIFLGKPLNNEDMNNQLNDIVNKINGLGVSDCCVHLIESYISSINKDLLFR